MISRWLPFFAVLLTFSSYLEGAPRDRVVNSIDPTRTVRLPQTPRPGTSTENDEGPVESSLLVEGVTLYMHPSADQQAALNALLEAQRDPSSPEFHRWLSPEEFAERFGASQNDINAIAAWLRSQGLTVDDVARGRNFIVVKGTAAQLSRAFQTSIHYFLVSGKRHFANQDAPAIPEALSGVVTEIRGLDDFHPEPFGLRSERILPDYTSTGGAHYIAPDDWATIYNVAGLYQTGLDGSGQKVAVVGQTDINLADIQAFRSNFRLSANPPTVILTGPDPGTVSADLLEAELDIEWAGAIARNATILYVNSRDVFTSAQYVINQNLAPVISMSYGGCEQQNSSSLRSIAQQASAQGITWIAASGDSGAAACDSASASLATHGLSVNIPASFPEVTSIGGTTFAEGSGSYWAAINTASGGSALSYIPETSWNDGIAYNQLIATGGGVSQYYSKPSWQSGPGVPADGKRDVPDISMSSSPEHDGYLIYYNGALGLVGGTSVPTPAFSGVMALLNQNLLRNGRIQTAGLGNINPSLYQLAQGSGSVFHDIVSGSNIVRCQTGTRDCTTGSFGYSATAGYDLVTGLGSPDLNKLVTGWDSIVASVGTTTTLTASPSSLPQTGSTLLTATVRPASGTVLPTGSVTFSVGSTLLGVAPLSGSGTSAVATLNVPASSLAVGSNTVVATYPGNTSFAGSSSSTVVTVTPSGTGASATFIKVDSTTQGNWKSAYGADGYNVIGDQAINPAYAAPVATRNLLYIWQASTSDVRALQKASNPADRIAATWYSGIPFVIDTNISDQAPHQVALYCLDWDSNGRRQTVDVLDSSGNVLNTQSLSTSFNGGVYLVWNVTGHVKFRVTLTSGYNPVVSGVFFGGGSGAAPPPSASATFVKVDSTTQGNWKSAYGADGYNVIGDQAINPSYAAPVATGNLLYVWQASTSDVRALQKASNPADRIAATWYSGIPFVIDTNISDQAPHQVALYCLDWDSNGRRQTVDVLDSNGNVLNTQSLSTSFNGGVYLVWTVTGHVKFRVTLTTGYNPVVSGVFFGGGSGAAPPPSASATFVKVDSTTQGNWKSVYGADGYNVIGDHAINPSYAAPVATGNLLYVWQASTTDIRALQKASNSADRIAATWYSGIPFVIDTNISDQAPHQVALYCLDWDTNGRRQTVDVLDSNGNVLDSQSLSTSFNGGVYLAWNVTGHVKFRVTLNSGYNPVVSGVFFR